MRLFVAWISDLDAPFDRTQHCDPTAPMFSFKLTQNEGAYAVVEITRTQSGWSFLRPSQPKSFLVSWSPTGLAADAVLMCRGRVTERPRDLLGSRQTIIGTCAPKDVDDLVLTEAKASATEPETDFLFSDSDPEDAESYLLGSPHVWHVDPATHAISCVHLTEGDRVLDMRDVAFHENGMPTDGPGNDSGRLVSRVRQRLVVEWTQTAAGTYDAGGWLAGLTTLDPSFFDDLRSAFRSDDSEGWSLADAGVDYRKKVYPSVHLDTGTRYRSTVTDPTNVQPDQRVVVRDHELRGTVMIHQLTDASFPMRFEYNQDRREVVHAVLDLPVLDTGLDLEDEEVAEVSLRDVFIDPTATDYVAGESYAAGQLVRHNGETYRCRADHLSSSFDQLMGTVQASSLPVFAGTNWGLIGNFEVEATYWQLVSDEWAVRPSIYSFLDTDRGQRALRHLMLRLRKRGILSMRDSRIAMKFAWQDAAHLTRGDSIRFQVWDAEAGYRDVVGKILTLEHSWPEGAPPTVGVEVGVSFASEAALTPGESYGEPGYGSGDYGLEDAIYAGPAQDDLIFETQAEPVRKPVLVESLGGSYAVRSYRRGGEAQEQIGAVAALASKGLDIREASVVRPTWVELRMRPLPQLETIEREFDVAGELLRGSQGVIL